MKYKTAADLRQAITARMRSLAKEKPPLAGWTS